MCGVQAKKRKRYRGKQPRLLARSTLLAQEVPYQTGRDFLCEHLRGEIKVEKQNKPMYRREETVY